MFGKCLAGLAGIATVTGLIIESTCTSKEKRKIAKHLKDGFHNTANSVKDDIHIATSKPSKSSKTLRTDMKTFESYVTNSLKKNHTVADVLQDVIPKLNNDSDLVDMSKYLLNKVNRSKFSNSITCCLALDKYINDYKSYPQFVHCLKLLKQTYRNEYSVNHSQIAVVTKILDKQHKPTNPKSISSCRHNLKHNMNTFISCVNNCLKQHYSTLSVLDTARYSLDDDSIISKVDRNLQYDIHLDNNQADVLNAFNKYISLFRPFTNFDSCLIHLRNDYQYNRKY